MMDIEQLAIEHGASTWSNNEVKFIGKHISFTSSQLEAFAKALQQQSEPVAWCIDDGFTKKILDKTPSDEDIATAKRFNWLVYQLYTQPPNTVPVEQYNKLLDAVNNTKRYWVKREGGESSLVLDAFELAEAIAEAERSAK